MANRSTYNINITKGSDGRWVCKHEFFLGRDNDGNRKRVTRRFYSDERLKSKAAADITAQIEAVKEDKEQGVDPFRKETTLKDYIQHCWSPYAKVNMNTRSYDDFSRVLEIHVIPAIGSIKFCDLRKDNIRELFVKLKMSGKSVGSLKKIKTALSSVLEHAVEGDVLEMNPLLGLKKSFRDLFADSNDVPKPENVLSLDQVKYFFNALDRVYYVPVDESREDMTVILSDGTERHLSGYTRNTVAEKKIPLQQKLFFYLALNTGLRRGESVALDWGDVNFTTREIMVTKSVERVKNHDASEADIKAKKAPSYIQRIKSTKTKNGVRIVDGVPDIVWDMLLQWKNEQIAMCSQLSNLWKGEPVYRFNDQPVFINEFGSRLLLDLPTVWFKKTLRLINEDVERQANEIGDPALRERKLAERLPNYLTLHGCRHTYCSALKAGGLDSKTIAVSAGHADSVITDKVYIHSVKNKAAEKKQALLDAYYSGNDASFAKA